MTDVVVVAVLSLIGTLVGSFSAGKLVTYRIEQLEKKVDKHNEVVEQFAVMKRDHETQWSRIDELKVAMDEIRRDVWNRNE